MDPSLMYTEPEIVTKGKTVFFNLGGMFLQPSHVDHTNFKCKIAGIRVYNEDFKVDADVGDRWTYKLPFNVPLIAPSANYLVEISAINTEGTELFLIESKFSL